MEYLLYIFCIAISVYALLTFKKRNGNSEYDKYENSRYYRFVIFVVLGLIAAIIALIGLIFK